MRLVAWMAGACVVSWILASAVLDRRTAVEVLLGMLAPLLVACGAWMVAERTYREAPDRLTGVMVAAFAAKLVFFGAYVAIMLGLLALRPVPFVVSFTVYFIALLLVEALAFRRLFAGGMRASHEPG